MCVMTQQPAMAQTAQTIAFREIPSNLTYGTPPLTVKATSSSGLPVTFTTTTASVCTVSGTTMTLVAPGHCMINANQAGNATYAAALQEVQSFTVAKGIQVITFGAPVSVPYPSPFTVVATSSSGLAVAFTSLTPSLCEVFGNGTVTPLNPGEPGVPSTCVIAANQAGNTDYSAASQVTQNETLIMPLQIPQYITFNAPSYVNYGTTWQAVATSNSGLTVALTSVTPSVCTVSFAGVTMVMMGTCTINANQAGNTNYSAAAQVTHSIITTPRPQTITVSALTSEPYGAPFTVSASSTFGLAVTLTSATTSVCTISGTTVTPVAVGTCTIDANQAGDADTQAAAQVVTSIAISPEAQSITFAALPALTYGAASFTVSATSSSGLAVTAFSSATTSVCTVSGSTVSIVGAGMCMIYANQAGNAFYGAAPQVAVSFSVATEAQSITFAALSAKTFGVAPFTVSATSTSGAAVTFASGTTAVCQVSGSTVNVVGAGTCTINANQVGTTNYSAAPQVPQSFSVAQSTQAITVATIPTTAFSTAPVAISASSTSLLAVAGTSATPSICTVSGSSVTLITIGTCTIDLNQSGNTNYLAAPQVATSFNVTQGAQTITVPTVAATTFGAAPFTVSATSTSGLAVTGFSSATPSVCTVASSTVTIVGAGTCTIDANQAGNVNYSAAPQAATSFLVAQESQFISMPTIPPQTFGGAAFAISATSTSGLTVSVFTSATASICTVSASTVTLVGAGTCTIQANQSGNANYSAAPQVATSFSVATEAQSITFAALPATTYGAAPFTVSATSTLGLPIVFTSSTTAVCTVSGTAVTIIAVGTCTIDANQSGNANIAAATQNVNTFTVYAPPTVSISGPVNGATVAASYPITFTANASGGTLNGVSYYTSAGTLIGTSTSAPYSYTATGGLAAGSYSIYAVASTSTSGVTTTSAQITLTAEGTGTGAPVSSSTPTPVTISAPSLLNPIAGSLPGSLGVSVSGAATYSMPLGIPPGVAGLAPSLVLNYSSQSGNGMLGMGWSLGGLSQIHRCNKTIAQDGSTNGVSFTNTDRLCLDGQRLILMTSPTSGNADADYWAVGATYSTEVANFSRITSYTGSHGLAFKVESKAGRVLYYGDQGDGTSYITAQGPNSGQALLWALGQVQDLSGNYYTISYSTNTTTGEYLPTQINYGGNLTTGLTPHLSVVFSYNTAGNLPGGASTRPDNTIRYVAGSHNDMVSLLTNVYTYTGLYSSGTATKVREYDINYEASASSGRSMIQSVQMQALNPQSNLMAVFPATTFNWGTSIAPAFTEVPAGAVNGPVVPLNQISDIQDFSLIYWADFNGDGKLDALVVDTTKSPFQYNIYLAQPGGGFAAPIVWTVPAAIASTIAARLKYEQAAPYPYIAATAPNPDLQNWGLVGDFDGDGSSDLFLFGGYVCLSQLKTSPTAANAFVCTDTGTNTTATSGLGASLVSWNIYDYLVMDTTGSGHDDILMRNGQYADGTRCVSSLINGFTFNCGVYTGTNFAITGTENKSFDFYNSESAGNGVWVTNSIGDFNGDGRQDLFRQEVPLTGSGSVFLEVCTSGTTGFTCGNWGALPASVCNAGIQGGCQGEPPLQGVSTVADVNGDGLTDILLTGVPQVGGESGIGGSGSGVAVCYSTGVNFDCHALTAAGTDSIVQHIGPIDSDGFVKTLSYEYTSGTSGTWRTCLIQNNSALNCQTVTGGPAMAAEPFPANGLPDPIIMFGGFLNDGTLNLLAYNQNLDIEGSIHSNFVSVGNAWTPYTLAPNTNLAADKLTSVTNGLGRTSSVTYTQGGQPSVYTQYNNSGGFPVYPQQSVTNPGYLVSVFNDSNGQGSSITTNYSYTGELTDAQGRGSLGFATVGAENIGTGLRTGNVYSQTWPYVGLVQLSEVSMAFTTIWTPISTTTNNYGVVAISNPYFGSNSGGLETANCIVCFPYIATSTVWHQDQPNSLGLSRDLGTTTSNVTYDNFGNLWTSNVSSQLATDTSAFITSTTNTWDNDTGTCVASHGATYIIGKLCATTVTKTNESGVSITHTASNAYFSTGLLQTEILEPTHTTLPSDNLQVANTYTRDGYGNVLTKNQSWFDPVSATTLNRTTSMTYTSDGRFPASSTNAMDQNTAVQTESYAYDSATGAKTQLLDVNKLYYQWLVDGLGRVVTQSTPDGNITSWNYNQCEGDCPANATMVTVKTFSNFNTANQNGVPELSYANPLGQVIRTMGYGFNGTQIATDHSFDALARQLADYQPVFVSGPTAGYASGVIASQRTGIDSFNRTTESETLDTGGAALTTITTYAGAVRKIQNPLGAIRTETRDVLGQLISVATNTFQNAPATLTSFAHDPFGNLTQTTDPAGNLIIVTYDAMGHKLQLNDPDLGIINYSVDPLGRTWKQVSPKENAGSQATTFQYDMLDRMISRIEPDLNSYFIYDVAGTTGAPLTSTQFTNCQTNHSCGKLVESYTAPAANGNVGANNSVSNTKDTDTTYNYDSLGRPANNTVILDPATFNVFYSETDYDAWSRPITQIYQHGTTGVNLDPPKVFDLRYNNMGYLQSIQRSGLNLWQALTQDAANRVVTAQLANPIGANEGLIATRCYDANTGRLDYATTATVANSTLCGVASSVATFMEGYFFDVLGNVTQRSEAWNQGITGTVVSQNFSEGFTYDGLNRIYTSTVSGQAQQSFFYSVDGSLTAKTGEGAYIYTGGTSGGPHAVKTIADIPGSFSYDINGNQLTGNGRTDTWTSFDMPLSLTYNGSTSQFTYGPNHERRTQSQSNGAMIYYGGAQEVQMNAGQVVSIKTYWPHGLGVEIDRPGQAGSELDWTHTDNLGSIVAITDVDGNLKEALGFDAWGSRRNAAGAPPVAYGSTQITENTDDKGYTGQEQIDSLELVHLNGRVYDPLVSKFLSGDPLVGEPTNGQNYNRYSYVLNNPMNMTDPTGFAAEPGNGPGTCGSFCTVVYGVYGADGNFTGFTGAAPTAQISAVNTISPASSANSYFSVAAISDGQTNPDGSTNTGGSTISGADQSCMFTNSCGANNATGNEYSSTTTQTYGQSSDGVQQVIETASKPATAKVEVFTEQPVGWWGSSLGHAAISINDTVHTFTHDGMKQMSKSDYLRANRFRNTIGISINVPAAQASSMNDFLSNYKADYSVWSLSTCVQPVYLSLVIGGVLTSVNPPLFPASLGDQILDSGKEDHVNFYMRSTAPLWTDTYTTRPSSN